MLVLGITDGITCGAAVVRDGKIVSAVNEERLCRLKMAYGMPRDSIKEVFDLAGATAADVDLVAVDTENNFFYDGVRPFDGWFTKDKGWLRNTVFATASRFSHLVDQLPILEKMYYKARGPIFRKRRKQIGGILRDEFGITVPVIFVDHHLCHATSAYFTSGFENATLVTMDGGGDGDSSHIYWVTDGKWERVHRTSAYNSAGNYYAYVTHICGYKAQKHEGKITGLAAHGKPIYRDLLNEMIAYRDGELKNVGRAVFSQAMKKLEARLPKGWKKEDLACSIQQHCEDLAVQLTRDYLNPGGDGNLAIAGGIFANVRINQMLYEIDGVKRIFVHPGMTDQGLAVGAALAPCLPDGPYTEHGRMKANTEVLRDVYFGRGFTDEEIEGELQKAGVEYSKPDDVEAEAAKLLADGYVVAWFDMRMEYGPRALGARSILYQPADPSVNDWLNERLHRTEFMPFAPATMIEHTDLCYHNAVGALDTARFMTITFDCTDWMRRHCPGVVHVDGTARPQLVTRTDSPRYYRVIEEFYKLTGVPSIINTSFNMHEEPIVNSPYDAIRAFQVGHLDYLAIGGFLAKSPHPLDREIVPMHRNALKEAPTSVPVAGSGQ